MVKQSICCSFSWKRLLLLHLPNSISVPKSRGIWQGLESAVPSFICVSSLYLSCFRKCWECLFLPTWLLCSTTEVHQAVSHNCLVTYGSVFKLARNIFFPLEIYEKHQQLFVFIFRKLFQEQNKITFINWQLLDSIHKGRRPAHYFWPSADPEWFSRIRSYSQMLDVKINNNNNGISDFMSKQFLALRIYLLSLENRNPVIYKK